MAPSTSGWRWPGEGPGGPPKPAEPAPAPGNPPSPVLYRLALWREDGLWELWVEQRHATLKHEQGLFYVAHALGHPGVPLKKLHLAITYALFSRRKAGFTEAWDSHQGRLVSLGKQPLVQRPVAREDDEEARRRLEAVVRDLRAAIADPQTPNSEKAEARRQLREIADFLRRDSRLSRDEYKKAADSVRNALKHLLRTLLRPGGSAMNPAEVRHAFARHIQEHLLGPSSRYAAPAARGARGERAGCLLYEPPPGVRWSPCRVTAPDDPDPFPGEDAPQDGRG